VGEDVCVVTTGVFEGVGQDREARVVQAAGWEFPVLVDGLGQFGDGAGAPGKPGGVEAGGPEGVAEEVAEHAGLGG
jgi:hypothetical protein